MVWGATIWRSTGNFGSTIYDPMGTKGKQELLEAYICDECLTAKGHLVYHAEGIITKSESVTVKTFNEHKEEETAQAIRNN
jgi:hypothetical protein